MTYRYKLFCEIKLCKLLINCVKLFFSMGGSIAVHVGAQRRLPSLVGLAVIDVVEGKV